MTAEPTYLISEVSKILERSVYWLRWKEKKLIEAGLFVRPDGTPLHIARSLSPEGTVSPSSRRRYTIRDIEDMAHLFIELGVYKDDQPYMGSKVLRRIALYKSIGEEGE